MIDSIVFRINNIKKYPFVINTLMSPRSDVQQSVSVDRRSGFNWMHLQLVKYGDTQKQDVYAKDWINVPSSHYNVYWRYNVVADRIEFNFSIPKFLYGNNIQQFIPMGDDPNLSVRFDYHNLLANSDVHIEMLRRLLRNFFRRYLNDSTDLISMHHVRIMRIDLAFNQLFPTKNDALEYLEFQKRVKRKGQRENQAYATSYKTSVYIAGQYATFKIYHKGSEYRGSDFQKHIETNERLRYEFFPITSINQGGKLVEGYTELADRILRYEVEFKGQSLTYLYRNYIFRRNDGLFRDAKKMHSKYKAYIKHCERKEVWKKRGDPQYKLWCEQPTKSKFWLMTKNSDVQISQLEKITGINMDRLLSSSVNLTMNIKKSERQYITSTPRDGINAEYYSDPNIELKKCAILDAQFFKVLTRYFVRFIKEYQIQKKPTNDQVLQNLLDYNQNMKRANLKGIKQEWIGKYLKLLEMYTIDELVADRVISRTGAWRLKKSLDKLGYSKNSAQYSGVIPEINWTEYYFAVRTNHRITKK